MESCHLHTVEIRLSIAQTFHMDLQFLALDEDTHSTLKSKRGMMVILLYNSAPRPRHKLTCAAFCGKVERIPPKKGGCSVEHFLQDADPTQCGR